MELDEQTCPQCGGNALRPSGYRTFKCDFCGTVLKKEEEPSETPPKNPAHYSAPASTNFSNTRRRYEEEEEDEEESNKLKGIIGALVVGAIGLIIVLLLSSREKPAHETPAFIPVLPEMPQPAEPFLPKLPVDTTELLEPHIMTVEGADIFINGKKTSSRKIKKGQSLKIVLRQPKGLITYGNTVYVSASITVQDFEGNTLYEFPDYHNTTTDGERASNFSKSFAFELKANNRYGFSSEHRKYLVIYRLTDEKGDGEIYGRLPLTYTP